MRDRRFGLSENILGLVDRQLARDAAGVPVPGDLQGLALFYDVFERDLDLTLGRANADIGCRDVAEQRYQHIVIGRDRGEIGGIGQFDAAAELAPEIKLPEDPEGERVAPEIALAEPGRKRVGAAFPDIGQASRRLLRLRIELADRHSKRGTRLDHPRPGAQQSQVLGIGDLDQPVRTGSLYTFHHVR